MGSVYLTVDNEVVDAGDPRAAFLAWRENTFLDEQRLESRQRGLAKKVKDHIAAAKKADKADPEPDEAKAVEGPVEDKAVEAPAENKARVTRASKE